MPVGVLLVGLGAVSTTLIAGVEAVKRGLGRPVGSITQMDTLDGASVATAAGLASLDDLVFGAWDIFGENAFDAAIHARVLDSALLEQLRPELESIVPMPAVFDRTYVRRLDGPNVKSVGSKWDAVAAIEDDIAKFKELHGCDRVVVAWCGSTEVLLDPSPVHETLDEFEQGLKDDDPAISPSMLYAYAAIRSGSPFVNGAPQLTADIPAMLEAAAKHRIPVAGKDFKTGQTLVKTIIAPGLRARMLGLNGWFSTNILGNRDGEVLADEQSFRSKEVSKLGVLEQMLRPKEHPELYGDISHAVRINYYPPAGDNKEGWDNIDLFGWLGYPMQLKVNFLCRDSILAAPLLLDLVLFMDRAASLGWWGVQDWLSFYFKAPMGDDPIHDLFEQRRVLDAAIRALGESVTPAARS